MSRLILTPLSCVCCEPPWQQQESTLKQVHAALQGLYEQQATAQHGRADAPVAMLLEHKPYRLQYNNMLAGIKGKGEREQGVDPQANTVEDTFSTEELQHMFEYLLQQETLEAGRNLSIFSYMAGTIARHDDANLVYLADLGAPTLMECIGEWFAERALQQERTVWAQGPTVSVCCVLSLAC